MDTSNDHNSPRLTNSLTSALPGHPPHKLSAIIPIYMLCIVLPIQFSMGPIAMNGARFIALLFILPLMVNLLSGKYGRLVWPDILFLAYCLWSFVSLFVNNPDSALQFAGSHTLELYGSYLLGRAYIRSEDDLTTVIKLLGLFITLSIPFALFEAMTGRSLILEVLRLLPVVNAPSPGDYGERLGIQRTQFTFSHPIHYGLYSSLAFTLALIGLKNTANSSLRLLFLTASILGVVFSMSSGALLYLFIQVFLIIWALLFRSTKWRWALLYLFIAILYVTIDILSNRTPVKVFMSYATLSPHNAYYRSTIFEWGMVNIWNNPILGIGLNDWIRPLWMVSGSVDNFWLLTAMRFGIPAFLLLSTGYVLALWRIGQAAITPQSTLFRLRRSWMFTFVGVTFTLTTVHIWWSIFSFIFFLFGTGIWFIEQKATSIDETIPQPNKAGGAPPPSGGRAPGAIRYTRFPSFQKK